MLESDRIKPPSIEEFKRAVRRLPELRRESDGFGRTLTDLPRAKREALLGEALQWPYLYEFSMAEQLALMFMALGRKDVLLGLGSSENPHKAVLDWADQDEVDDWRGGEGGQFSMQDVLALAIAMQRNILSIMLYHRSIAALLQEVRGGEMDSLFLAVRVDRAVLSAPTVSRVVADRELSSDRQFFLKLRSALKGPSRKHWEAYRDLRYALVLLREMGFAKVSDAELEDLLVYQLKLYSPAPSARKNLRKQLGQAKRFSTT